MVNVSAQTIEPPRFELLSRGNPKVLKGRRLKVWTFVLHLAPSNLSGRNVCPMALPIGAQPDDIRSACSSACLNLSGRGGIAAGGNLSFDDVASGRRTNSVQAARVRRTNRFFDDRAGFMAELADEIRRAAEWARANGFKPAVRLNGTSDIRWELEPVTIGRRTYPNVMAAFPRVVFYDYTKIANRRGLPRNYHLTFSLSETNEPQAWQALAAGMSVAVVFRDRASIPAEYMGARVVDGDETDLRFLDPAGCVVALYAKGPAKRDRSGFVRDAGDNPKKIALAA